MVTINSKEKIDRLVGQREQFLLECRLLAFDKFHKMAKTLGKMPSSQMPFVIEYFVILQFIEDIKSIYHKSAYKTRNNLCFHKNMVTIHSNYSVLFK